MKQMIPVLAMLAALSGCAMFDGLRGGLHGGVRGDAPVPAADAAGMRPAPRPVAAAPVLGTGRSAAALDQTTAADKAAALAAPKAASERDLGRVVVALGSPAEQGFWLRSALVAEPGKGRVVTASGASVAVDLLPGTGAASLSLAAFRALGLALTDLPQVQVFAN